ncbi:unnamed protein product, partial [Arabidopsis halleri]
SVSTISRATGTYLNFLLFDFRFLIIAFVPKKLFFNFSNFFLDLKLN